MNDVFISYAHIDDQALTEGQKFLKCVLANCWARNLDHF